MKKNTLLIISVLAGFLLVTSYSLAGDNRSADQLVEPLHGIQLFKNKLSIRVKSNGCTLPEHFRLQTEQQADSYLLSIVRTKADRCRKMPRIISLELDLPETVKNGYKLVNLLQAG